MTLKNKFDKEVRHDENGIESEVCVLIAEEFAIGFAEWTFINFPNQYKVHQYKEKDGFYTTKKLLEIYKKEKAL